MIVIWLSFLSVAYGFYMPSNISIASDTDDAIGLDQFYKNSLNSPKMNIYNYENLMDEDNYFYQNDDTNYDSSQSMTEDDVSFNESTDVLNSNSSDDAIDDDNYFLNKADDLDFDINKQVSRFIPLVKRSSPLNGVMESRYALPNMHVNYGVVHNLQSIKHPLINGDDIGNGFMTSLRHPQPLSVIGFPGNDIESLFDSKPDGSKPQLGDEFPKNLCNSGSDESRESNLRELIHQEKPMDIWNNFLSEIMTMNQKQQSRINHLPGKEQNQFEKSGKQRDDDDISKRNATDTSPKNYSSRFHKYIPFILKNVDKPKRVSGRKGQRNSFSNKMNTDHLNKDLKKTSANQMNQFSCNGMVTLKSDNYADYDDDANDANKVLFKIYKQYDQPNDEFLTVRLFDHMNNPFPNIFREIPPPSVVANINNKDVLRKLKNKNADEDNEFYEFKFKKINKDPFPNLFFEKPKLEPEEFVIRKLPMKKPKSKNFNNN